MKFRNDIATLDILPVEENGLCVMSLRISDPVKTGKFVDSCISDTKSTFYSHYLAIKDQLWQNRRTDCAGILKIVGEGRLSTKNADKLTTLSGTIYPKITEDDNKSDLSEILSKISKDLQSKDTSRLVIRNLPNIQTYSTSLTDTTIDVPCATQFQFLKNRFVVTFRAHALKSEFIADFCLIFKYYFLPVYQKSKTEIKYQIVANTTQEIEYLKSEEIKKFVESL